MRHAPRLQGACTWKRAIGTLSVLLALASSAAVPQGPGHLPDPVSIDVDLARTVGEMTPIWAYIGYDEANYTYLPDGRRLLTDFSDLSRGRIHVRTHNMLNTHDESPIALKWEWSNVYTEDDDGTPVYDFTMIDRIVDTWVDRGIIPVMEIGFMPRALTTHAGPYRQHWHPGGALQAPRIHSLRAEACPPHGQDRRPQHGGGVLGQRCLLPHRVPGPLPERDQSCHRGGGIASGFLRLSRQGAAGRHGGRTRPDGDGDPAAAAPGGVRDPRVLPGVP